MSIYLKAGQAKKDDSYIKLSTDYTITMYTAHGDVQIPERLLIATTL